MKLIILITFSPSIIFSQFEDLKRLYFPWAFYESENPNHFHIKNGTMIESQIREGKRKKVIYQFSDSLLNSATELDGNNRINKMKLYNLNEDRFKIDVYDKKLNRVYGSVINFKKAESDTRIILTYGIGNEKLMEIKFEQGKIQTISEKYENPTLNFSDTFIYSPSKLEIYRSQSGKSSKIRTFKFNSIGNLIKSISYNYDNEIDENSEYIYVNQKIKSKVFVKSELRVVTDYNYNETYNTEVSKYYINSKLIIYDSIVKQFINDHTILHECYKINRKKYLSREFILY